MASVDDRPRWQSLDERLVRRIPYLIEELLCLLEDMLELGQFEEGFLQSFRIGVHLMKFSALSPWAEQLINFEVAIGGRLHSSGSHGYLIEFILELLKRCLEVYHFSGLRSLRVVSESHDREIILSNFTLQKTCRKLGSIEACMVKLQLRINRLMDFGKSLRSFRSISSHRRTSLTNFLWKALVAEFSCKINRIFVTTHFSGDG